VAEVEKEIRKVIPLIDKKLALDGVCKKYLKKTTTDADFKSWAEKFVNTLNEKLDQFAPVDEQLVDDIQSLRASKSRELLAKSFLDKFKEDSVRQLITIGANLTELLGKATPVADRIAAYSEATPFKSKD
jgi:hypothetical protein